MTVGPDLETVLGASSREALRHLELYARRTVEGMLHGIHRSKRKGVSTEFDHHKLYQAGDPLKHIDWKASAKHERYFVKRYLEDTALTVRVVVDRSASMLQASEGASKYLQAARLAACLVYLILNQRDAAALTLAAEDGSVWLPPGTTEGHLVRMLQALCTHAAEGPDGLESCLRAVLDRGERRGMVAVASDLMFAPEPVQRALARLAAQGHEILLMQVRDPMEEDFPFNRWVQFRDLENPTVRHRLDTVPLKKIYREEYSALVESWRTWARKYDAHFVTARTTEPMETVLSAYLHARAGVEGA